MTTWDLVMYGGEREMLELRFAELAGVPNLVHIIVQGDKTFRGDPRTLSRPFDGPNRTHWLTIRLQGDDAWAREKYQRDIVFQTGYENPTRATHIRPDDVVIVSDVDEIPRADLVANLPEILENAGQPLALQMRMHYWGTRWQAPTDWFHPKASLARWVQELHAGSCDNLRMSAPPALVDAGWHLTWWKGPSGLDGVLGVAHAKLRAFSHAEFDTPEVHAELQRWIDEGWDMHGNKLLEYEGTDWPRGLLAAS